MSAIFWHWHRRLWFPKAKLINWLWYQHPQQNNSLQQLLSTSSRQICSPTNLFQPFRKFSSVQTHLHSHSEYVRSGPRWLLQWLLFVPGAWFTFTTSLLWLAVDDRSSWSCFVARNSVSTILSSISGGAFGFGHDYIIGFFFRVATVVLCVSKWRTLAHHFLRISYLHTIFVMPLLYAVVAFLFCFCNPVPLAVEPGACHKPSAKALAVDFSFHVIV